MKTLRLLLITLTLCLPALAWDCPAGQIRQQAPAGTPVSTPYYDVVEGIAFVCVPTPTGTPGNGDEHAVCGEYEHKLRKFCVE